MPKKFRYEGTERWLKGNVHTHTLRSDGGKTPAEVSSLYAAAAYDFLYLTDHWEISPLDRSLSDGILVLNGVELDGYDDYHSFYHIVCLGRLSGLSREGGLTRAIEQAEAQGAYLILAHPHWSGNSFEEAMRYPFNGVEIFNSVGGWINGKHCGLPHWDALLKSGRECFGFAVDDAHIVPEMPLWRQGWIHVAADECSEPAIMNALKRGRFYASCGPEFHSLACVGRHVFFECTPVRHARLIGAIWEGFHIGPVDGSLFTEGNFEVPPDFHYARLEIEDEMGKTAWTNTLFIP